MKDTPTIISERIKKGIDFLTFLRNDYQLDPNDPRYLGFINVGIDNGFVKKEEKETFKFICDNESLFEQIMEMLGMTTEDAQAGQWMFDIDETIFILTSKNS